MLKCLICDTEYLEEQINICSVCGYNFNEILSIGNIPKAFLEREAQRINWARKLWVKQQEDKQQQEQVEVILTQILNQTLFPELIAKISELELKLSSIEGKLDQSQQERQQIQSELAQIKQSQSSLSSQLYNQSKKLSKIKSKLKDLLDSSGSYYSS